MAKRRESLLPKEEGIKVYKCAVCNIFYDQWAETFLH